MLSSPNQWAMNHKFSPLLYLLEHIEIEQLFLCNDLLSQLSLCHSGLHIVVESLQFHLPTTTISTLPSLLITYKDNLQLTKLTALKPASTHKNKQINLQLHQWFFIHSITSFTNHLSSSHSAIPSPVWAKGTSTTIPPLIPSSAKAWLENKRHPLLSILI